MNKTLVGAVLIAVLVGLGGGFVLGYIAYEPRLQSLQSDLNDLNGDLTSTQNQLSSLTSDVNLLSYDVKSVNSTVMAIENRRWHEATSMEGSTDAIGANFEMHGEVMRLRWRMQGLSSDAWIQIHIRYWNGTSLTERGSSGIFGSCSSDITETVFGLGFYLEVNTYNLEYYLVAVTDYY
jgi:phage-related tail fiber protein